MLQINPSLTIDEKEIVYVFIRASGPGGQNVNKVATAVQLRFDVRKSPSLTEEIKEQLLHAAGKKATHDGVIVIEAKRHRTQEQNRQDATTRLTVLIRKAVERPKSRRATRPSPAAKARRVESKKKRGAIKRTRRERTEINE
jgi:ribosome-associated protein